MTRVRAFSSYLNVQAAKPNPLDTAHVQAMRKVLKHRDIGERTKSYTQANGRVVTITMYSDGSEEQTVEREGDTVSISGQKPKKNSWR